MVSTSKGRAKKKVDPGPSKSAPEDKVKKNGIKVESSKEKPIASQKNSRKRKIETEEVPTKAENKTTVTKNKAKKQKTVLEVPTLKSFTPGKVFVVGENNCGQIGLNDDIDSKEKPYQLDLPHSCIDIAAGSMQSMCLTETGEVFTFGCNDEGALGRVTSEAEDCVPRKVDIPEKIVQISAGDSHSAGLAESGQVYLWGNFRGSEGQIGLRPDGKKQIKPVKILSNEKIVKIASGDDHLACLSEAGLVYTCGCAEQGQLGRVSSRSCKSGGRQEGLAALLEPHAINLRGKKPVKDVWTESFATFLKIQETESIYACGLNNYNQLGFLNKNDNQVQYLPKPVSSFDDKSWQQICGGQHHTIALDSDGSVHALGRKDYGRLGLGENAEDKSTPTVVPTLETKNCINISCGNCVSYAVTQDGSLYSWGMESTQLGHGSEGNSQDILTPRLIEGKLLNSFEVLKVSGGGQHTLILARPKQDSSKNKKV